MKRLIFLMLVLIVLVLTGCTTRLVDFTIISTKNVDLSKAATFQRGNARIQGVDLVHIIIFIPTGVPNMKEAIDKALESVNGAVALVDGVVYSKAWYIPYIYGQQSYVVEGTPLIDPSLTSNPIEPGYYVLKPNGKDTGYDLTEVSADEYASLKGKLVKS